jgi:hypothetical protein
VALAVALASSAAAEPGDEGGLQLAEHKIKAGLIYNLLKYVSWPPSAADAAAATVCVFGTDPFEGSLEPMRGRTVNQREIALRRVNKISDTDRCHLLFVSAAERERWPQLSAFLSGKSVLTVSDFDHFAGSGGMVELGRADRHIEVSIDLQAVTAAGLAIEDRLLRLAHVIPARP